GLLEASNPASVVGVCVSAPGPLDTVAVVASHIPTLSGFVDFPLKAELQKRFPFPVDLENDAIAAAIGESQFGAGKGLETSSVAAGAKLSVRHDRHV
ncbi:ROK family protein, partial [Rhizobium ruizarguesonis]